MIEYINALWALMTVFFTDTVFLFPLYEAFILFLTIFFMIYLMKYIFDELMRAF